jgi:serine/threonine-protein kinase
MSVGLERLGEALADRYRLDREVGQGGMAMVYLAQDLRHDRKVALKVLRPELAAVIGAERFLAEIKITANLQHPHILPLFDSGRVDGSVFYVMPFVQGESLRDRLVREKQLPIDDAVRIAREVADALAAAHAVGIIHRDIKPENILLKGGHALVADFGIALAASRADGTGRMTETGMSLGTPHYMSPEQAMGERQLDARADVYALGCVLYEMLTGEPPFTGPTAQAILAKVMTERPTPIHATRDTVPPGLEAATFKALAKLPADRYASATAFGEALTRTDERMVIVPRRGTNLRLIAATAAATLVVSALAFRVLIRNINREPSASGEPRRYSIVLPDSAPLVTLRNAGNLPTRSLAVAPDGRSVVYVAGTTRGHRLWLVRLDASTMEELPGTEEAWSPAYSPDSKQIAFVTNDGSSIRRLALDTKSPPRRLFADNFLTGQNLSFGVGPDGRLLMIKGGAPTRTTRLEVMTNFPAYVRAKLAERATQ